MRKSIIFIALILAAGMAHATACGKQGCPDYNQTPSVGVGVAVGVGVGVNATNTNTNTVSPVNTSTNTVSPNITVNPAINPTINPTISPVISPTNTNTVAPVINNNPTNTQTSSQDNNQTSSQTNSQNTSQTNGQANSQSTTFTSPDKVTVKNVPAVMSGNVYPTSPCMGSSQAGGSGVGFGLSVGTSWTDDECGIRETARSFSAMHMTDDAVAVLCSSKYASAAPSCKKADK